MFETTDRDELIDVLDSFQIAMFAINMSGDGDNILMGRNRAFCRLHDVTPDQDIGHRISQILDEEEAYRLYEGKKGI